jgi:hypothetical protein
LETSNALLEQVQAVTVSDADRLEAEAELTEIKASQALDKGVPEIFGEDVFLSKLFRRASILNASFFSAVTNVVCSNLVVGKSCIDDDQPVEIESFFRDADLYHTQCLYAEQAEEGSKRRGLVQLDSTSRRQGGSIRDMTGPNISFGMPTGNDLESGPAAEETGNEALFSRSKSAGFDPRVAHTGPRASAHDHPSAVAGFGRATSAESDAGVSLPKTDPFAFGGFTRSRSAENDTAHPYGFAGFTRSRSAESDAVSRLDSLTGHRPPRAGAAGHAVLERQPAGQSVKGQRPAQWTLSRVTIRDYVRKLTFRAGADAEASLEFRLATAGQMGRENAPSDDSRTVMLCRFLEGSGLVAVHSAPVKSVERMREKLLEYARAGDPWAGWPLTANILDPIRASIVCNGPSQLLQVEPPAPHPTLPVHNSRCV